ncbi:MAG: hypothetical protein P9M03_02760 [Candidatus Theseobacter exili]|nr:hypothetical protein [Candidatus Theseobacter exili]
MQANNLKPVIPPISETSKFIGYILVVISLVGLLIGIISLINATKDWEVQVGITVLISSISCGLFSVLFFGLSAAIKLLAGIEFNTRKELPELSQNEKSTKKNDISFDDWKKENPTKSINEYYAAFKKTSK